ncbi:MAG: AlpA family phage regulatory protein [Nevskiaceae bacterium]|nr:MAG: AlpA family phage regulatory protein [Burkholderiaceae bacterium]TBR72350.1 MAG: AlpA family phage regulatory protein [Nevskiaceae bacterium]
MPFHLPPPTNLDTLPNGCLIPVRDVARYTGIAIPTIWRWSASGRFPRAIRIGSRCTRWRIHEVRAWISDPTGWGTPHATEDSQ